MLMILHFMLVTCESLIQRLEHDSVLAIECCESNYVELNSDRCHLLLCGYKH